MSTERLAICVIDNGSAILRNRTLQSLKDQKEQDFSCEVLDCTAFWPASRNRILPDADYVLYLYSGSVLEENAVEVICKAIRNTAPAWLYFDEQTYSAAYNGDVYGVLEKPDFDLLSFVQAPFTGEGAAFSRETLEGMDLKYDGSNYAVALLEMAAAAAAVADGLHIRECLMIRHDKCGFFPDEEDLLAEALKRCLEKRTPGLRGIRHKNGFGLCLLPEKKNHPSVSVICMTDSETAADFEYLGGEIEVLCQPGGMSDWDRCLCGAQKASGEILCFLDPACEVPSREDFQTLLDYAALPYAGMVSPCLYHQNELLYTGTFTMAGKLFGCARTEENMESFGRQILMIRQTALLAWQFWMVSRDLLIQTAQIVGGIHGVRELPDGHLLQEFAISMKNMGRRSLYIGSVPVRYGKDSIQWQPKGGCEMLLRQQAQYFLDGYCPVKLRSWMRESVLKGVKGYFPDRATEYSPDAPKVFVLSHELSLTGAPVVLAHAVRILTEAKWQVVVASPVDGVLKTEFLRDGVPVLILGDMEKNEDWLRYVSDFDLILVNTVVPFRQIEQLCGSGLPVMWWLHDARSGYETYLRKVLPDTLTDNIHIFSVSQYADDVLKQYRPSYRSELLLYGLKDEALRVDAADHPIQCPRRLFVSVGTVIHRKGQDILAQAVRLLPDSVRDQCLFLFIGKCIDRDIFEQVLELEQTYPDAVRQIDMVPHDDIFMLYRHADAVICSSRDDPLPTFMAETMMVSGVCICSENTGTAAVIDQGVNGFLYRNDDPAELAECIQSVVACENLDSVRKAARRTFEQVFSMDVFRKNLLDCAMRSMKSGEEVIADD